jgi:hypothetical protein
MHANAKPLANMHLRSRAPRLFSHAVALVHTLLKVARPLEYLAQSTSLVLGRGKGSERETNPVFIQNLLHCYERVLFIGTRFSNLCTAMREY